MSFILHWHKSLCVCNFSGEINGKEIIACNKKLYTDIRFDDIRFLIWNFSAISMFEFSDEGSEIITSMNSVTLQEKTQE